MDDITSAQMAKFRADADATVNLETGRTWSGSEQHHASVQTAAKHLTAMYCYVKMAGSSTAGLSYRLGDLEVRKDWRTAIEMHQSEVQRLLGKLKTVDDRIPFLAKE